MIGTKSWFLRRNYLYRSRLCWPLFAFPSLPSIGRYIKIGSPQLITRFCGNVSSSSWSIDKRETPKSKHTMPWAASWPLRVVKITWGNHWCDCSRHWSCNMSLIRAIVLRTVLQIRLYFANGIYDMYGGLNYWVLETYHRFTVTSYSAFKSAPLYKVES